VLHPLADSCKGDLGLTGFFYPRFNFPMHIVHQLDDFLCILGTRLCQGSDLIGHHRKTGAIFTRMGCLNRRIHCQKVSLGSYFLNYFNN
jgi:hypothetical protein